MARCPYCGVFEGDNHHSLCASQRGTIQNRAPEPDYTKEMYRLLVWGEALMRSMSGWPENHPNEFVEWKEEWRKLREKINVR